MMFEFKSNYSNITIADKANEAISKIKGVHCLYMPKTGEDKTSAGNVSVCNVWHPKYSLGFWFTDNGFTVREYVCDIVHEFFPYSTLKAIDVDEEGISIITKSKEKYRLNILDITKSSENIVNMEKALHMTEEVTVVKD